MLKTMHPLSIAQLYHHDQTNSGTTNYHCYRKFPSLILFSLPEAGLRLLCIQLELMSI